jgi:hypothetical protein
MPNILTSWKEIGQYLGKGVRTVQRWEREAGLPVRRRNGSSPRAVLAIPDELNDWARSSTRGPTGPVTESLRKELSVLREETSDLRRRLELMEEYGCAPARRRIRKARRAAGQSPRRQGPRRPTVSG